MIELKMPALSPTMEEGTLAKWLVKVGDAIKPGDLLAEVETDKATMEFEAADEGVIAELLVEEGTDGVRVGAIIALLGDMEPVSVSPSPTVAPPPPTPTAEPSPIVEEVREEAVASTIDDPRPAIDRARTAHDDVSALAARIAEASGIDLAQVRGSGPNGRIMRLDLPGQHLRLEAAAQPVAARPQTQSLNTSDVPKSTRAVDVPHARMKLSSMRKTIARRLTESKQQVPHIYLTVDVRLDALLSLRARLNDDLSRRGLKISVNDMIIRAQALALIACPETNVQFDSDELIQFQRADISVAVSLPGGLITPVITSANVKGVAAISAEMKDLAARAREGKLKPEEYQGGTASLSNLGMFGIKQFEAVINPPQAMILAVGRGEERIVPQDGQPGVATMMSLTGSFDHRAIDGADAARMMGALRSLIEDPLQLLV